MSGFSAGDASDACVQARTLRHLLCLEVPGSMGPDTASGDDKVMIDEAR